MEVFAACDKPRDDDCDDIDNDDVSASDVMCS